MENNKIIQTTPPRLKIYSEQKIGNKPIKRIRDYKISSNIYPKKNLNNKAKETEENEVIKLQSGAVIGKLYKKTNETEWAAQNRAIKEKNQSNYEVNQIIKRYNFHKGKLKYGYSNDYINLLTELLHSRRREYSKERLQLSKYRINLCKNKKKGYDNYLNTINNKINNSENKKDYFNRKMTFSAITSPKQYSQFKSKDFYEKMYLKTFYNINGNNNEEKNNKTLNLIKNKKIFNKINNYKKNTIESLNRDFKNNNKIFYENLKTKNINNLDKNENESSKIYLKILNQPNSLKNINKMIEINSSNNSIDKSNSLNNTKNVNSFTTNKITKKNSPKKYKVVYQNERDIYFEKENEEDEFLVSGNKDQYENYLKNKFDFYEDMEDKQTQYIYEIKKRNTTLFNYNKNIEVKNNHKSAINYISKIYREKKEKGFDIPNKGYKIHDIFKENYTKEELRNMRLNHRSKNFLKTLKFKLQ